MDDREFLDLLYQMWARTTGAKDRYWDYEDTGEAGFDLHSVSQDERDFVGYTDKEADADFITALHGALPDLIRVVTNALDEADRLAFEHDARECRIAELEIEVAELKADLEGLIAG